MGWAAAIPLIMSGVSAAAGALGNRGQKSGPNYSPAQQNLLSALLSGFQSNLNMAGGGGLLGSIINSTLSAIGKKTSNATNLVNNLLTQRGLSRTTGGASQLFNPVYQGMTEKANFLGQVPQLRYNLNSDALMRTGQFFNSMPTGQQQSGNILGGLFTGAGAGLGAGWGAYQQSEQNKNLVDILRRQTPSPTNTPVAGGINPVWQQQNFPYVMYGQNP